MKETSAVEGHFDAEADRYDYWKEKNWYYYDALKSIAREYTAGAQSVLDAGCGTGGVTSTLKSARLVGIDISPRMIAAAKDRHKNTSIEFVASDIVTYQSQETFDRILFFDVIEHSENPKGTLKRMAELLKKDGLLVVSMANPLWEPILLVAEKLGMKMPEGPHDRISAQEMISLAKDVGLHLKKRDFKLIFPKYVPGLSYLLNEVLGRLPIIRRLSVIEVFVFAPEGASYEQP